MWTFVVSQSYTCAGNDSSNTIYSWLGCCSRRSHSVGGFEPNRYFRIGLTHRNTHHLVIFNNRCIYTISVSFRGHHDCRIDLTRSPAVARKADPTASQQTLIFRENYLCARSAFRTQSCVPNLKPLAQAVFEILRSKRIGVTSLTFQGHVTSSVT